MKRDIGGERIVFTARRRDGSVFPVRLSVGRVPDSVPPRFVGVMRDVSAEHLAAAALKLQRDRANAFLELHDSILLELDPKHRIREINSRGAELLGGSAACIIGRDCRMKADDQICEKKPGSWD